MSDFLVSQGLVRALLLRVADHPSEGHSIPPNSTIFETYKIDRRTFFEYLSAVTLTPVLAGSEEARGMWGLIAKVTLVPGRRDEMIGILKDSAADMPGCLSYVVAKDAADENTIWVTEVWDSMASHDAALSLPAVKNAIPRSKAIVSSFEKIAVTNPVWGAGLPAAKAH